MPSTNPFRLPPTAAAALDALHEAVAHYGAACDGDPRFIDDEASTADLASICARCPVFAECIDYSSTERPLGGFWAGRQWRRTYKRKESAA